MHDLWRASVRVRIRTRARDWRYIHVPVLFLFFDINMSGLKKHFWPHMQAGWGRTGPTFGLFFWPHVQPKVAITAVPKLRYYYVLEWP